MNITLTELHIHLLLNIDIIPGCKLLLIMLQFGNPNIKFTYAKAAHERANFSTWSVVILKLLQD